MTGLFEHRLIQDGFFKARVRWPSVTWREILGNNKLVCPPCHAKQPITASTNVLQHCYMLKIHGAMLAILRLHLVARRYNGYPLIPTHRIYAAYTG